MFVCLLAGNCLAETWNIKSFEVAGSIVNCLPIEGSVLNVKSDISIVQEGGGTPSPDNVRNFVATESITLIQSAGDNQTVYILELENGIYAGSVDWQTGEVLVTHKVFRLPIAEMNNDDGPYPGWKGVEGFKECFSEDVYKGQTFFYTNDDRFSLNMGTQFGVNYGTEIIILNESHYGKTLQDWKEQYPDLICQLAAPLLIPQYVYVAPLENTILAQEGVNRFIVDIGEVTISGVSTESVENMVEANYQKSFNPYEWGLPVLELYGTVDGMSRDKAIQLSYVYDDLRGECSIKWQGSSSLAYEKKNYTVTFDKSFEAAEGWGAEKKYCLKANYIDHSHARNIVNAKLWGQVVKSRDNVPAELMNLPNGGAVDGFPIIIMLNDEFHGLYTFNIPKDGWLFGMGAGSREAIVCADAWVDATGFKSTALVDGSDFELEYVSDKADTEWVTESLNRLIEACMNSDGTDLDTTVSKYIDWQSAIDYYIFTVLIEGADMTQKNYLLTTFDGVKWYFSAYDMDCTYGLQWDGLAWLPADNPPTFNRYAKIHLIMELIKTYKADELIARYWELRSTVLSESNVATVFANYTGQIPTAIYLHDSLRWPMIPNTSVNNISQIRDYYRMRVELADAWIEALQD